MKSFIQILEGVKPGNAQSVQDVIAEAINDNNVKAGSTVAVVGDPTYPFDGCRGTVKSLNGGFALVEFKNGTQVNLHVNLLVGV